MATLDPEATSASSARPRLLFALVGSDLRLVRANDAFASYCGRPRSELVGASVAALLPPGDRSSAEQLLATVARTLKPVRRVASAGPFAAPAERGSTCWDVLVHPVLDEQGRLESFVFTACDVTDRARAQEALRESEARYREVFNSVSDAIFVVEVTPEARFRFVTANPAAERVSGTPAGRLAGTWLEEAARPGVVKNALPHWRRCVATGEAEHYVYDYVRPTDGAPFFLLTTVIPIRDGAGAVRRLLVVNRDVTELKRAEEEVRTINDELQRRVTDGAVRLQEANEELESFSYTVSHDLRGPIRHIDGFTELARRELDASIDDHTRHNLACVAAAARRMGDLVDDLLSYSRLGRRALASQEVKLEHVVREAIRDVEQEARGRTVIWNVGALPTISADPAMLRIAFASLLSNALKFTRSRPEAVIEIGALAAEGPEEVVFVRDNGIGFDMAHAGKLFRVFERLHGMEELEGTGIGLATVRRIATRHGGRAWAEGAPGAGATFYLALPRRRGGGGAAG